MALPPAEQGVTDALTSRTPERLSAAFPSALELAFAAGKQTRLPLLLGPAESQRIGLRIRVPTKTKRGTSFTLNLVQRENGKIVSGVALRINVR